MIFSASRKQYYDVLMFDGYLRASRFSVNMPDRRFGFPSDMSPVLELLRSVRRGCTKKKPRVVRRGRKERLERRWKG